MESIRNSAFRRFGIIMLSLAIVFTCIPWASQGFSAHAAPKKVKSTAYNQVIKKGYTAYVAGASGIYKVRLVKGKLKSKKVLVKAEGTYWGSSYASSMYKGRKYLYYAMGTNGTGFSIWRISLKSGKKKLLASIVESPNYCDFVIKGKKIYYSEYRGSNWSLQNRQMSLNGKSKKKSRYKAVQTTKVSNKKGYKVITKQKGNYYRDYIKTPKGTFYLGKVKNYF